MDVEEVMSIDGRVSQYDVSGEYQLPKTDKDGGAISIAT